AVKRLISSNEQGSRGFRVEGRDQGFADSIAQWIGEPSTVTRKLYRVGAVILQSVSGKELSLIRPTPRRRHRMRPLFLRSGILNPPRQRRRLRRRGCTASPFAAPARSDPS